jgi:hypothetical protein
VPAPADANQEAKAEYLASKRLFGIGGAFDGGNHPVVSSEQTSAQMEASKQAYRATLRAQEPTTVRASRVFAGDILLVHPSQGGVDLVKVENLLGNASPNSVDLVAKCVHWTQTKIDPDAGGLWGQWSQTWDVTPDGKKHMGKMNVHRSQMLVFNVQMSYDKKKIYISLETLRVLSRVSIHYEMPARVSLTHLPADDSDDSDSETDEAPRAAGRAQVASRQQGRPVRVNHVPSAVVGHRQPVGTAMPPGAGPGAVSRATVPKQERKKKKRRKKKSKKKKKKKTRKRKTTKKRETTTKTSMPRHTGTAIHRTKTLPPLPATLRVSCLKPPVF